MPTDQRTSTTRAPQINEVEMSDDNNQFSFFNENRQPSLNNDIVERLNGQIRDNSVIREHVLPDIRRNRSRDDIRTRRQNELSEIRLSRSIDRIREDSQIQGGLEEAFDNIHEFMDNHDISEIRRTDDELPEQNVPESFIARRQPPQRVQPQENQVIETNQEQAQEEAQKEEQIDGETIIESEQETVERYNEIESNFTYAPQSTISDQGVINITNNFYCNKTTAEELLKKGLELKDLNLTTKGMKVNIINSVLTLSKF